MNIQMSYIHIKVNNNRTIFQQNGDLYSINKNVGIGKSTASYTLDVSGDINATGDIKENSTILLPSGSIMLWSGTIATIPTGWALCDGTNGRPDLRNRFVIGGNVYTEDTVRTNITGTATQTGGSKDSVIISHQHYFTTSVNGSHTHRYDLNRGGFPATVNLHYTSDSFPGYDRFLSTANGAHNHSYTTGSANPSISSASNANLPPYYVLAYIIKL